MKKSVVMGVSAVLAVATLSMVLTSAMALHIDARIIQNIYQFSIGPGGYWTTSSSLSDDVFGSTTGTGYVDKYIMTVTSTTRAHIEVTDCCMVGDTIALGDKPWRYFSAFSPAQIIIDHTFSPGVYVFYVGYIPPHTGVFPAGYNFEIWG